MDKLRQFALKINIEPRLLVFGEPMSEHTTFRIGGPADLLVRIRDEATLLRLVRGARESGIPVFVLGGGANLLVGDRGIRGIVADLTGLDGIRASGTFLEAQAGVAVDALCLEALARGLSGLEDFYGMPGTLGGAFYMNARCYDAEMGAIHASMRYATPEGRVGAIGAGGEGWSYKRSPFQPGGSLEDATILGASLRLEPGDPARIASRMRARRADRESKGHYRLPSAGSVFKNDRKFGRPSGAILDSLGFKGRRVGMAAVSAWHANIFVNEGGATAADMRALIEGARAEVLDRLGLELEPEVRFVGEF